MSVVLEEIQGFFLVIKLHTILLMEKFYFSGRMIMLIKYNKMPPGNTMMGAPIIYLSGWYYHGVVFQYHISNFLMQPYDHMMPKCATPGL